MKALLWCFPHEMRSALAFRDTVDEHVMIRNVRNIGPDDIEPADRVYASTYCYGRVVATYEGTDYVVKEEWLAPDYRHRVDATDDGYQLMEKEGAWRAVGDPQPTSEEAWAILDETELGLR